MVVPMKVIETEVETSNALHYPKCIVNQAEIPLNTSTYNSGNIPGNAGNDIDTVT
jgi:hypothetical protein